MRGFLGDPTKLFIKPEKPDFFLRTPPILGSLASSENRLGATGVASTLEGNLSSLIRVSAAESAAEKLADWRKEGGGMVFWGSEPPTGGAGAGRRGGLCSWCGWCCWGCGWG